MYFEYARPPPTPPITILSTVPPFPTLYWDFFLFSFSIESSLCCPVSLGSGPCPAVWLSHHYRKRTLALLGQWWDFMPTSPPPMLGSCLAAACSGLRHAVCSSVQLSQSLRVHLRNCPVVSGKHCFLDVTNHLWLLESLQSLFWEDPEPWGLGVWYVCPI